MEQKYNNILIYYHYYYNIVKFFDTYCLHIPIVDHTEHLVVDLLCLNVDNTVPLLKQNIIIFKYFYKQQFLLKYVTHMLQQPQAPLDKTCPPSQERGSLLQS